MLPRLPYNLAQLVVSTRLVACSDGLSVGFKHQGGQLQYAMLLEYRTLNRRPQLCAARSSFWLGHDSCSKTSWKTVPRKLASHRDSSNSARNTRTSPGTNQTPHHDWDTTHTFDDHTQRLVLPSFPSLGGSGVLLWLHDFPSSVSACFCKCISSFWSSLYYTALTDDR